MLFRLRLLGVKPAASTSLYVPPHYSSSDPQRPTSDSSPPTTPAQKQELQIAIGYLLYYGRCGWSGPPCRLCPGQRPHHRDAADDAGVGAATRLRGRILTDASYLSRPKAGSVGGSFSFHHLTRGNDPTGFRQRAYFGALDGHTYCMLVGAGS